jgi:hypothetical protein
VYPCFKILFVPHSLARVIRNSGFFTFPTKTLSCLELTFAKAPLHSYFSPASAKNSAYTARSSYSQIQQNTFLIRRVIAGPPRLAVARQRRGSIGMTFSTKQCQILSPVHSYFRGKAVQTIPEHSSGFRSVSYFSSTEKRADSVFQNRPWRNYQLLKLR